jgi:hypothetical protein
MPKSELNLNAGSILQRMLIRSARHTPIEFTGLRGNQSLWKSGIAAGLFSALQETLHSTSGTFK